MGKVIITPEMINSLYSMLMSSSPEDKNVAMGILNNRDLKNEESEKNVEILTDKYLSETWGSSWNKIKLSNKYHIFTKIENQISLITGHIKLNTKIH